MSLQYYKGQCIKEQQRLTKFAPRISCKGPHIRDSEELCRVAVYPDHTNDDGTIKVEGISRKDLTDRGFSIFRKDHSSRDDIINFVDSQIERNPARRLEYLLMFFCREIRLVRDDDDLRAFIIIDSSEKPHLRGHSLILCSRNYSPSKVKELRKILVDTINKPKHLDQVYA